MKKLKILLPVVLLLVMFTTVNVHCKKEVITTIDTIKDIGIIYIELLTQYDWEAYQIMRIDNNTGMLTQIYYNTNDRVFLKYHFTEDSIVIIENIPVNKSNNNATWWYEDELNQRTLFIDYRNPDFAFEFLQSYKIIKLTETGLILADMTSWISDRSNYEYYKKVAY